MRRVRIARRRAIDFVAVNVYPTPMLVCGVENACRELRLQQLDPGEHSVRPRMEIG